MLVFLATIVMAGGPPQLELPCATPLRWAPVVAPVMPELPPPPGDLGLRDAFGVELFEVSEHFVLRWGPNNAPSPVEQDALLAAFEDAWQAEIEGMDHTAPFGTDQYHFNVYVGNTGGGTPTISGAAGYYTVDSEGWPIIVIGREQLNDQDRVKITVAHEFYHAIQGATGRYNYDPGGPSAWLWEATATAAAHEVYPENDAYAGFLFGYAFHPHLRLDFFDYPNQGVVTEYYQYGAFIFPLHVADRMGSWQVIRDVWEDPGDDPDPLAVLAGILEQQGVDFDELWMDHIARNAVWDYPDGEVYEQVLRTYNAYPEARNNDPLSMPVRGRETWTPGPPALRPQRYGSNRYVIVRPIEGTYNLVVEADAVGTRGGATRLGVTLVLDSDEPEYRPLTCTDTRCEGTWDDLDEARNAYFVVGTWTESRETGWRDEAHPFQWQLNFTAPPEPEPEPVPKGCGCSASGSGWVAAPWLALVLLPWWRRRR